MLYMNWDFSYAFFFCFFSPTRTVTSFKKSDEPEGNPRQDSATIKSCGKI